MQRAESMSVPSQSKTTRSNRLGIGCIQPLDESGELHRQRRFESDCRAGNRMSHRQSARVEKHALQAFARERLVEIEIAVLVVARDGMSEMREMYPDLVRAPGLELGLDEAVAGPDALRPENR